MNASPDAADQHDAPDQHQSDAVQTAKDRSYSPSSERETEAKQAESTGDAVRPAEAFANGESFLMINSDNFYPTQALEALRRSSAPC